MHTDQVLTSMFQKSRGGWSRLLDHWGPWRANFFGQGQAAKEARSPGGPDFALCVPDVLEDGSQDTLLSGYSDGTHSTF